MKVIWMNSGGKDCKLAYSMFKELNSDAIIDSLTIQTDDTKSYYNAIALIRTFELDAYEVPYRETRRAIGGYHLSATPYWIFEAHYRGIQYALQNGYDVMLSGGTNVNIITDTHDSSVFDDSLLDLQELLEVPLDKRVNSIRPIKHWVDSGL